MLQLRLCVKFHACLIIHYFVPQTVKKDLSYLTMVNYSLANKFSGTFAHAKFNLRSSNFVFFLNSLENLSLKGRQVTLASYESEKIRKSRTRITLRFEIGLLFSEFLA